MARKAPSPGQFRAIPPGLISQLQPSHRPISRSRRVAFRRLRNNSRLHDNGVILARDSPVAVNVSLELTEPLSRIPRTQMEKPRAVCVFRQSRILISQIVGELKLIRRGYRETARSRGVHDGPPDFRRRSRNRRAINRRGDTNIRARVKMYFHAGDVEY